MIRTISTLYDTYADAEATVSDLEAAGVASGDISIVANDPAHKDGYVVASNGEVRSDTTAGAEIGAAAGGVAGAGVGLLTGLGLLAIPGVGPVVAAGWLVATAAGTGVGLLTGGLIGSLTGAGVSREDADVYAEGVRRGGTLVTVRIDEAREPAVTQILRRRTTLAVEDRARSYRDAGWTGFDETAEPYTQTELDAERERLRRQQTTLNNRVEPL